tara:strand:+ start:865 stop:1080 length:216 start_codon:yes stop_codon:yes gene_type:complete
MIDPYIIDLLKKEEEKLKEEPLRAPLHIHPPDFDRKRAPNNKPNENNKNGYIEVDFEIDLDINQNEIVIDM